MASDVHTIVVQENWHSTAEGETILQCIYNPQTSGRKLFGILERPIVPPEIEEVSYKLFFSGKASIGKTITIAQLAGIPLSPSYVETRGICKTNIYWPTKIWDKVVLFKLQCWDAGDNGLKKYSYISPACEDKADCIVFVFSFADANSFADLPQNISKLIKKGPQKPAVIVIGTRYNMAQNTPISASAVADFEQKFRIPILKITDKQPNSEERNEVHRIASVLNFICEKLWIRDQEYIVKQCIDNTSV